MTQEVEFTDYKSRPTSLAWVMYVLGLCIPVIIGLYWPAFSIHPFRTGMLLRPALLGVAVLLGLVCAGMRLTSTELKLAGLLASVCLLCLATTFSATDVERGLEGWIKLLALSLFALTLSRALRDPALAKGFGHSLFLCSLLVVIFILFTYVRLVGLSFPTYESARRFKGLAAYNNIPLNTISFTAVLAYVEAMCLVRSNRFLWGLGVFLVLACSFFTGSRAPVAVMLLAGLTMLLVNGILSPATGKRFTSWVAIAAIVATALLVVANTSFVRMSQATEGRWDLWFVARQKFLERPLLGFGFESVRDDLLVRLPGVYKMKRGDGTFPGGYHNEYMTALAERGLIGFLALALLYGFVSRLSWQLAFLRWKTWRNGQCALLVAVFLIIRATVETPGLFGYANDPDDYLAYLFLAFLVSRFSIEEDHAHSIVQAIRSDSSLESQASLARQVVLSDFTHTPPTLAE